MTPKAPQPRPPRRRRMPLRRCAKPEFRSELLCPDQSGFLRKHFSTYRLSTSWTTETLPVQGHRKPARPIKATPVADRSHSGKKLDISKIKGAHLLFEMQDRQEKARGRESEAKEQAATSHWVAWESTVLVGNFPPDFRQGYRHCPMELELSPSQRIWPQRPPARARNVLLMLTMRL